MLLLLGLVLALALVLGLGLRAIVENVMEIDYMRGMEVVSGDLAELTLEPFDA